MDGYISYQAIDVFLACYLWMESPIPALLADIYCSITYCHERRGKKLICCLPLLNIWLTAHVFKIPRRTNCPMTDFRMYQLGMKNSKEWAEYLVNLQEGRLQWCIKGWQDITTVIYSCGTFPNVILIGIHGCINNNPSLALRQLGYPMMGPPTTESITPFIYYYLDGTFPNIAYSVHRAWSGVARKGRELGVRSCDAKDTYRQWVRDRVATIGLPFISLLAKKEIPTLPQENEDPHEVRAKLLEIKKGKRIADEELVETRRAFEALKKVHDELKGALDANEQRLKDKHECLVKTKKCLTAANQELGFRRREKDEASTDVQKLKTLLSRSVQAEKDAFRKMNSLEEQLAYVNQALAEEKRKENRIALYAAEQDETAEEWAMRLAQLANLTNSAIADFPSHLKAAEAMVDPFNTLVEIKEFVEYCKIMLKMMKDYVTKHQQM